MRFFVLRVPVIGICFFGLTLSGLADTSFRCGNDIISIGYTMYKIREICGDPVTEKRVGEKKTYRILENKKKKLENITYVTEWVFRKDSGMYLLTFEGSRLTAKEYIK